MEYSSLVQRAWSLTWRHRFLWVLGLFAGGAGGQCAGSGGGGNPLPAGSGSGPFGQAGPDAASAFGQAGHWLTEHLGLVLLAVGLIVLLGFVLIVISFIAQGAMTRATVDLALGRRITLGQAWSAGRRLFWRFLGLSLVLVGLALAVALAIGVVVGLGWLGVQGGSGSSGALAIVVGVLFILALGMAAIPVLIAVSIVVALAMRALVVDELGPRAALGAGYRLLRANLGTSLVVWLLSVGLSIAAGLVVFLALLVLAVPLGIVGVALYAGGGASAGLVAYGVAAVLLVIAVTWIIGAVVNTFFANYWSLAYLYFSGRLNERFEPFRAG